MLDEPKPFASLGPSLLARKGGARPAMRPQFGPLIPSPMASSDFGSDLDDLGWNDMGTDDTPLSPFQVSGHEEDGEDSDPADASVYGSLLTSSHHERGEKSVAGDGSDAPSAALPHETRPSRSKAIAEGRRAAFTLRLDAERHLKLRLASAVRNISAQQLVTQAIDELFASIPDIDALAAQVKRA